MQFYYCILILENNVYIVVTIIVLRLNNQKNIVTFFSLTWILNHFLSTTNVHVLIEIESSLMLVFNLNDSVKKIFILYQA